MSPEPHLDQVRPYVVGAITPLVPTTWDIKPGIFSPTKTSQPTLYCEYKSIEPLAESPAAHARVTFELTIATELEDIAKGETAVDAAVVDLVLSLAGRRDIVWSSAEKVVLKDTNLAWKVTVSTIARIAKTPEE